MSTCRLIKATAFATPLYFSGHIQGRNGLHIAVTPNAVDAFHFDEADGIELVIESLGEGWEVINCDAASNQYDKRLLAPAVGSA